MYFRRISDANFAAFVSVGCECIISAFVCVSEKNGFLGLFLAAVYLPIDKMSIEPVLTKGSKDIS